MTGCPPPTNGQARTASGWAICEGGTTDQLRKLGVNQHAPLGPPRVSATPVLQIATIFPGGIVLGEGWPQNLFLITQGKGPVQPGDQNPVPFLNPRSGSPGGCAGSITEHTRRCQQNVGHEREPRAPEQLPGGPEPTKTRWISPTGFVQNSHKTKMSYTYWFPFSWTGGFGGFWALCSKLYVVLGLICEDPKS